MEEKLYSKILSLASIWWFGPLSGAVIAIGLTNIVGVCLTLLYYLSNLEKISLNLILVVFSVVMLLFANVMIMFASVKKRQQFLIPWLVTTPLAILSAIIYCSLQWDQLTEFRVPLVAAALLSVYFLAVVASYYHELVAPAEMQKFKEQAAVVTFTDKNTTGGVVIEEQTVLVALEHEDTPPAPRHPCPDEVIIIGDSNKPNTNPFLDDFIIHNKQEKREHTENYEKKVTKEHSEINLKANFTPFKKTNKLGDKTPAKMKIFLPGTEGEESDFDFSFNDPDFDSSLVAESHPPDVDN